MDRSAGAAHAGRPDESGAEAPEQASADAARRLLTPARDSAALDRLSARARRLLRCADAQVSLLLGEHVVVAAAGPSPPGTGIDLLTAMAPDRSALVVEDARKDDRVRSLDSVLSGAVGALLAVPLVNDDGLAVGALTAHDRHARRWSPPEVTLLRELASSAMGELALSALSADYDASRMRWDLAIEAARIGTFDWDLTQGRVEWDEMLQELFGYAPGEFVPHIDEAMSRVHPEDREQLGQAIEAAVSRCGDYRAEFRAVLPGGGIRWMSARGRALGDADGRADRLVGVAYDVTEVRDARDSAARVLSGMAMGFLYVDRTWTVAYLNGEAERVLGRRAEDLVGRNLWAEFPGAEDEFVGAQYRHAMETGEVVSFEARYADAGAWFEVRVTPDTEGLGVYFLNIAERRAAQEEAERSTVRLDLLGTVSGELAATFDAEEAVSRLARLVVPVLADWCLVSLVTDGALDDVSCWHVDPDRRAEVEEYSRQRMLSGGENAFLRDALLSASPVVMDTGATEAMSERLPPGATKDMLTSLAPESGAVFPLPGRDGTVGLLTLLRGAARSPMEAADLTTAQSVAFRAGLALDNARLYHQQLDLAAGLQRNMLTDPPQLDDVGIVVRYQPAARAAAVGGDWYDSFVQASGETMVVIGDVVGHDVEAAAAMGQLRGLLRGIAFHSGSGPGDVLTGLDAAMEGLRVNTTATAVVARLERVRPGAEAGATRMSWSNAGHPPPVVIEPDGSTYLLTSPEPDLLLGLDPATRRHEGAVMLEPGSTVLFYTDGLTERRGESIDTGAATLLATLRELDSSDLDRLCDDILARLLPRKGEDDVALIAVRLHHPGSEGADLDRVTPPRRRGATGSAPDL